MTEQASVSLRKAAPSPDGEWLVYGSDETGRREVYVQRTSGVGGKRQVSNAGGTQPVWSPDGTEIFYRDDTRMFGVPVTSANDELALGEPEVLLKEISRRAFSGS
jgi:Tol biopolymer transport system component